MTARLRFHESVEPELASAAAWYDGEREGLGAELIEAVGEALARIQETPAAGAPWHEFRKRGVRRFPYLVVYRELGPDEVEIVAVAHMHREPGYWTERR